MMIRHKRATSVQWRRVGRLGPYVITKWGRVRSGELDRQILMRHPVPGPELMINKSRAGPTLWDWGRAMTHKK